MKTVNKLKISTTQPSLQRHAIWRLTPTVSNSSQLDFYQPTYKKYFIKGISVLSLFKNGKEGRNSGSMTVEAAIVLPVFLFFFLNFLWIIEIYNLHSTLLAALREVGRELSVYAYAYDSIVQEEEDTGLEAFVENAAFSYLYVKQQLEGFAGEEYLDNSPLTYGKEGISYLSTSVLQENDVIDLVLTYQVSPFIKIAGYYPARFYNRYYGRAWTGYDVSGENEKDSYVYIAQNAKVYHLSRDCTHIRLSVTECGAWQVDTLRNAFGSRYLPCELCVTGVQNSYYVAEAGERYHQELACSGLKRTVTTIQRSEAEKLYKLCERCGR